MSIFDVFRVNKIKIELEQVKKERDRFKRAMAETERMEAYGLKKAIEVLISRKNQAIQEAKAAETTILQRRLALNQQISELNQQIAAKKEEIIRVSGIFCGKKPCLCR